MYVQRTGATMKQRWDFQLETNGAANTRMAIDGGRPCDNALSASV